MMAEPKPLASLSSSLLARKGYAKPAMRRQSYTGPDGAPVHGYDDLGWNDMGDDVQDGFTMGNTPVHRQIEDLEREIIQRRIVQPTGLTPFGYEEDKEYLPAAFTRSIPHSSQPKKQPINLGPTSIDADADGDAEEKISRAHDDVTHQGDMSHEKDALPLPAIAIARAKREVAERAKSSHGKAAFTLRLDSERHLKLRLASAIERVSAQQLVTMALDRLLNSMPQLSALSEDVSDQLNSQKNGDR